MNAFEWRIMFGVPGIQFTQIVGAAWEESGEPDESLKASFARAPNGSDGGNTWFFITDMVSGPTKNTTTGAHE
jgi:hypothetical protein